MDENNLQETESEQKPVKSRKRPTKPKTKSLRSTVWESFLASCPSFLKPPLVFLSGKTFVIKRHFTTIVVILAIGVVATVLGCRLYYNAKIKSLETDKENLTKERDKAQEQLAPWVQLANSQFTNTPLTKRMDALLETVSTLKANEPTFALFVNDKLVTNRETIGLDISRKISLRLRNTSSITVEDATLSLNSRLVQKDVIAPGWDFQALPVQFIDDKVITQTNMIHIQVKAQNHIPSRSFFIAPDVIVSTNCVQKAVYAEITVSSKGSRKYEYQLHFQL